MRNVLPWWDKVPPPIPPYPPRGPITATYNQTPPPDAKPGWRPVPPHQVCAPGSNAARATAAFWRRAKAEGRLRTYAEIWAAGWRIDEHGRVVAP